MSQTRIGMENPPDFSTAGRIVQRAREALVLVRKYMSDEERAERVGGFFCVADAVNCEGVFCQFVGERSDKDARFRKNACEKILRLCERAQQGHQDLSTFVTRDVSGPVKHYGGGIRANNWFVAFSGLPERDDESLCLIVAIWEGWITLHEAKIIASISSNERFLSISANVNLRAAA